MKRKAQDRFVRSIGLLAAGVVCLMPAFADADETGIANTQRLGTGHLDNSNVSMVTFPIQHEPSPVHPAFDLGGSETRKLELQLSEPLTLSVNNRLQKSSSGVGSVFLDSSLNLHLNDNLDITASLGAGKSRGSFQPLGSIHCQNGVLEQGSYRASDCHYINQANVLKQDQIAMGLRYGKGGFSTAVSMFQREASFNQQGYTSQAAPMASPVMGAGLTTPVYGNPLAPAPADGLPLNYLKGETTGLDMEFLVGLSMDSAGDLKLGLQLTRVLGASYEASSLYSPSLQSWTIANPFDSAQMNLDWSKGDFSGGIQGFYREQVQFLNRDDLDSVTTFDVHFTWRAPWNANLSVGTTNILNANGDDKGKTDTGIQDPFESVYGRIPYVRYQQDL